MVIIRSIAFNTVFYINLIVQMIVWTPLYFLLPPRKGFFIPKFWAKTNNWLLEKIAGTSFEIEGLENIPPGGYIFAPKHQSFWDVFALLPWLDHPVYILKRELTWIPLFGWYVLKQRMIPVNRAAKGKAIMGVMERAREEMAAGRQLIIYPEGTRRPPGAEPAYKFGIARIYSELNVPVVPVVMHPGLFWPRRKFLRFPGHFKVRILKPIAPGLEQQAFYDELVATMERESDHLLVETAKANPDLPLPAVTRQRLAELASQAEA